MAEHVYTPNGGSHLPGVSNICADVLPLWHAPNSTMQFRVFPHSRLVAHAPVASTQRTSFDHVLVRSNLTDSAHVRSKPRSTTPLTNASDTARGVRVGYQAELLPFTKRVQSTEDAGSGLCSMRIRSRLLVHGVPCVSARVCWVLLASTESSMLFHVSGLVRSLCLSCNTLLVDMAVLS